MVGTDLAPPGIFTLAGFRNSYTNTCQGLGIRNRAGDQTSRRLQTHSCAQCQLYGESGYYERDACSALYRDTHESLSRILEFKEFLLNVVQIT